MDGVVRWKGLNHPPHSYYQLTKTTPHPGLSHLGSAVDLVPAVNRTWLMASVCLCVCFFMWGVWGQELRSHHWCHSFLSGLCYAKLSACPTSLTYLLGCDFNKTGLSFSCSFSQTWSRHRSFANQLFDWLAIEKTRSSWTSFVFSIKLIKMTLERHANINQLILSHKFDQAANLSKSHCIENTLKVLHIVLVYNIL